MKFKGLIIWLLTFAGACMVMHHACTSVQHQLEKQLQEHQRALEEQTNVH